MKELYEKYEKVFLGIATVCMLYLVFVKYSSIASIPFEVQVAIAVIAYLLIATVRAVLNDDCNIWSLCFAGSSRSFSGDGLL